jgi:hypothetical protein
LEPVSPELALVDPALARADLERLAKLEAAHPGSAVGVRVIQSPSSREPARRRRWWTIPMQVILALSLGVNGFVLARVIAREDLAASATPSPPVAASAVSQQTRRGALVEQKLLALVVQSPRGKLPAALIDRRTGLAENNLQAACHGAQGSSFLCVLRSAHATGAAAYVRYVSDGNDSGAFTWLPGPPVVSPRPWPEHRQP